ncbi:hypothetical protein [Teredinibacter sp. KSP-S5-2]|uniref:hypothetical protein n=1 Tax=Teredinibacter sp. KSP-S5-2 TaxID=3034506 RepID=UPI0029342CF6|nr:hypothetical protein [Teredinibacter sp. KSP-S5-2]WNO10415.1 hypothetical protein P5V12_04450 [Teredinibacter sp. KSP-S5-2]
MTNVEQLEDAIEELSYIQEQITDLLEAAKSAIVDLDIEGLVQEAETCWMAHIASSLSDDNNSLGDTMTTLSGTIQTIQDKIDEG